MNSPNSVPSLPTVVVNQDVSSIQFNSKRKRSVSPSNGENEQNIKFRALYNEVLEKSYCIGLHEFYLCGIEVGLMRDVKNLALLKEAIHLNDIKKLSIIGSKLSEDGILCIKSSFQNLININLSNNFISSTGTRYLADGISKNKVLKSLNISSNQICGVSIERFNICGTIDLTGLKSLLDSIITCSNLHYVDLSSNYLGGFNLNNSINRSKYRSFEDTTSSSSATKKNNDTEKQFMADLVYGDKVIQLLSNFLLQNTSVVDLNISTNGFEDRTEHLNLLLKYVGGSNNVCQSLCGRQNKLIYPVIRTIYGVPIKNDPNVIPTYDFCGANLSNFCGRLLGHELSTATVPLKLNLSNNVMFGNEGLSNFVDYLLPATSVNKTSLPLGLTELSLNQMNLTSTYGLRGLFNTQKLSLLITLDISDNPMFDESELMMLFKTLSGVPITKPSSSPAVASPLKLGIIQDMKCPVLLRFILQNVGLTNSGCNALRHMIINNNVLEELDISFNRQICDDGMITLVAGLLFNKTLKKLRMCEIGLTAQGPIALASVIQVQECGLTELDISSNKKICGSRLQMTFDPSPVFSLMDSIKDRYMKYQSEGIQKLNFSNADIGARACKRLMDTCLVANSLHSLNLRNCHLSEHGASHLGDALPRLHHLKWLNVSDCFFGPNGCITFFNGLAQNNSLLWIDISKNQLTGYASDLQGDQIVNYVPETIKSICNALTKNTMLQYLNLESNSLFGMAPPPYALPVLNVHILSDLANALQINGENNGALRCLNINYNHMPMVDARGTTITQFDNKILKAIDDFIRVMRNHPSLSSICGNLYPALKKRDYGQKELYPEFNSTNIIRSSSNSNNSSINNLILTSFNESNKNNHSSSNYMNDNISNNINSKNEYIPLTRSASSNNINLVLNNESTAEYYAYDFEDGNRIKEYNKLDLANWTNDWGVVSHLVAQEIRFSHYLEEVQLLNVNCGSKMSKVLKDNIYLKRFICPAKAEFAKFIEQNKLKSFTFRISLAVFLKGMGKGRQEGPEIQIGIIRTILEYAIGCGPLVVQLMEKYVL